MTIRTADPVVVPMSARPEPDGCRCRVDRRTRAHHDRLLAVETDPDELLDLLELAVTWHELDYSQADVVPPERWCDLAAAHRWRDPERAARLFALATDIAVRAPNSAIPRSGHIAGER